MPLFIGRKQELERSLALLSARRNRGVVQDVVGMHGIGKSIYLERLADHARELPDVQTFSVDLKRHGFAESTPDFGRNASTYALWGTFAQSCELMADFAGKRLPEFDEFRLILRNQKRYADRLQAQITVNQAKGAVITDANVTAVVRESDEGIKQSIRELQSRVDDAFVKAWTEYTAKRQVLITADSFELVADDEMGGWLVRMAGRLPNTVVALARIPSDTPVAIDSAPVDRIPLPPFTLDEVTDYFREFISGGPVDARLVEIAHSYTDGHPGGIRLIANLVDEMGGATLEPASLRRVLNRLPARGDERWAELVRLILNAVHEPILLNAVDATALTTTFDAPLLRELITRDDLPKPNTGEIITQLLELGLLQQIPALSGEPSDRYRLHEFIRLSVAGRLRTRDPGVWQELHRGIAQHYFRKLKGWDDSPYDTYGAWYRFEDPVWQENKREWLYHSGMLHERPLTRARFVLVFLEAFWWWGCYLPFPFNRRLIEDWGRAITAWAHSQLTARVNVEKLEAGERQLEDALTFVLDNYPTSYVKPADAPWDAIRDKLLLVRRRCDPTQARGMTLTVEEKEEVKRVNALISLFLAHTRRFRDPSDPMAELYYREALTAFDEMKDQWNVAWLLFERADLARERGDLRESATLLVDSANWAKNLLYASDEWDHELIGDLHRTRADVLWEQGDLVAAGTGYGRAVAHAYWVQGDPHAPDEYTQQFYVEMTTRAAERIASLADRSALVPFLDALRAELPEQRPVDDTVAAAGLDVIRERVFPRGPTTDELREDDSPFMLTWSVRHEEWMNPAVWLDKLAAGN